MFDQDLVIDSFAGGGGASLGIAWATGHAPDVAINHDADALAMHARNHPSTRHVCEDVWHANLRELTGGRSVGLLWASPDCKHFSRAKGSVPVSKHIRSLAWVVVRWASQVRPAVIILENVREFADWGPLVPRWECRCGWKGTEGQTTLKRTGKSRKARRRCPRCDSLRIEKTGDIPDPTRKGMTFNLFKNRLRGFGYEVEWRNINAADYGAPTHRRRLFLIARCDGAPIVWPEPTHGDPKKLDDLPLFHPFTQRLKPWRTAAECIDWSIECPSIFNRKKPLAEKTLRRIAFGIKRYVLDAGTPFVVPMCHSGDRNGSGLDEPMPTVTTAKRGEHAIVTPILAATNHGDSGGRRAYPLDEPLRTVQASARGSEAIICPTLIQTSYGERKGQAPRVLDLHEPLGTVVAGGQKHSLVAAYIAKHFGGMVGVEADTPLPTTTERGTQNQLVAANLVHMNHGEKQWNSLAEPLRTVTGGNHAALVYSFLVRYFGTAIGQHLTEPLFTITGKDRFGLVTVTIAGELYMIVDIGMRMLTPRELARAQGFPDTYALTGTKTNQVAKIGNSVCPQVVEALVRANVAAEVTA
ncbi:MAG: DNA cytosine methyltransferase [Pirellulales bacterium]